MLHGLDSNDRILVLGAGGWLGQTALSLLADYPQTSVLAYASRTRRISVDQRTWALGTWHEEQIRNFSPTVILDFSGLTPNLLSRLSQNSSKGVLDRLTKNFCWAMARPGVRLAITMSSGAASSPHPDLYGLSKRHHETSALAARNPESALVILRAYSLSGRFVAEDAPYAFSQIVRGAISGTVRISSTQPTWRRYVAADDALRVAVGLASQGHTGVLETGGDLVELGDFAQRVIDTLNPSAKVVRAPLVEGRSIYASDNKSWTRACEMLDFSPKSLPQQIQEVASVFRN